MYRIVAHTADAGIEVEAPDLNCLFAEAGRALFSLIVSNLDDVASRVQVPFTIEGSNTEHLLVDWLNELLFAFESQRVLLREFDVSIGPVGLQATGRGEIVEEHRHHLEHEVKAITYHDLRVQFQGGVYRANVIVDI
jgi:SHS2 domain-containing protein